MTNVPIELTTGGSSQSSLSPTCRPDDPTPPDFDRFHPTSTALTPKPLTLREPCASRRSASVFRYRAGMVRLPAPPQNLMISRSIGQRNRAIPPGSFWLPTAIVQRRSAMKAPRGRAFRAHRSGLLKTTHAHDRCLSPSRNWLRSESGSTACHRRAPAATTEERNHVTVGRERNESCRILSRPSRDQLTADGL
jgi:hypothetical protein